MDRADLIRLVGSLTDPRTKPRQIETLAETFADNIPHPAGTDLLFYPENWGLSPTPSPEEIVSEALSWRPRIVAMRIEEIRSHPKRTDLYCYGVTPDGKTHTQVISGLRLAVGDICVVAASGIVLADGQQVRHRYLEGAYTFGEILRRTDQPPGTEFPS